MKKLVMVAAAAMAAMNVNANTLQGNPAIATATGYSGYTVRVEYKYETLAPDAVAGDVAEYASELFAVLDNPGLLGDNMTKADVYAEFDDSVFGDKFGYNIPVPVVGQDGGIQWNRIDGACGSWKGAGYVLAALIDGDGKFSDDNTIAYGYFELTDAAYQAKVKDETVPLDFGEFKLLRLTSPSSVPEPTSGLLLLLGVAGLALKRKHA